MTYSDFCRRGRVLNKSACIYLCAALILSLAANSPALSDQTDNRLDGLFGQLLTADNSTQAREIEQQIWNIWFHHDGTGDAVDSLLKRGRYAVASEQLEFAEKLYSQLIEVAPDFAEGWNRRATVRYMRGDFNGSIADIEATLRLEPRHFGAISGLGLCRIALEDLAGAARAFRDVLAISPHASGPKFNLDAIEQMLKDSAI